MKKFIITIVVLAVVALGIFGVILGNNGPTYTWRLQMYSINGLVEQHTIRSTESPIQSIGIFNGLHYVNIGSQAWVAPAGCWLKVEAVQPKQLKLKE